MSFSLLEIAGVPARRFATPLAWFALVACGLAIAAESARAAAVLSPVANPNTGANRSDGTGYMIGYDFTVGGSDIVINSLGAEDIQNVGGGVVARWTYGDGTFSATQAGIWNSSGTLLGSVTIKANTGSPIADGFRYEPLSAPITLLAGQSYTIGAQKGGGVDFFLDSGASAAYVGNGVTLTADRFNGVGTFAQPVTDGTLNNGRWSGGNATLVSSVPVDTPALFSWAGTGTTLAERNNFTGTVGYQFTTGPQGRLVKSLGFFDQNLDGLATSHQVGIWDATTQTLLAQVTVAAGTADTLYEFFRYHDLTTPLTLLPNTAYWIGAAVTDGGDIWYNNSSSFSFNPSTDPKYSGFTVNQGVFLTGSFGAPTSTSAGAYFLAPNMLVPEPSSFALLLLGMLGIWRLRQKRTL